MLVLSCCFISAIGLPSESVAAGKKKPCVIVYEHTNYKGKSKKFCSNVKNLKKHGFNDKISSYKLIGEGTVIFYQDADYKGTSFYGRRVGTSNVRANAKKVYPGFNDKISSIKLTPRYAP